MPRRVFDRSTGQVLWVDDNNVPMGFNPGLGSLPGQAMRREEDIRSRLPDAQIAGYRGPSVVDPRPMRGARPEDPEPQPVPTYRPLAGAKQNHRGNGIIVDLPASVPETTVIVGSIIETPRNGGDDAEAISIVCGYEPLGETLPEESYEVLGTLEFGIGGASFNCEFDWNKGTCFTVPASFVRVKAQVTYAATLADRQIALSAALGYGSSTSSGLASKIKRTFRSGTLAPGQTYEGVIPNFANGVTIVTNSNAAQARLRIFSSNHIAHYQLTGNSNEFTMRDGQFPIPRGATRFDILNTGAVDFVGQVIFNLGL